MSWGLRFRTAMSQLSKEFWITFEQFMITEQDNRVWNSLQMRKLFQDCF